MSLSTIDQSTGNATVISGNVNDKVGNLAALTTTDKSSCVGAVNEVKSGLINKIINQPTTVTFDENGKGSFTSPAGYSPLVASLDPTWITTVHYENGVFFVIAHKTYDPTVFIKSTTVTYNLFLYFC